MNVRLQSKFSSLKGQITLSLRKGGEVQIASTNGADRSGCLMRKR